MFLTSVDDRPLGGKWYVRTRPADPAHKVPARLQLIRELDGVRYVAVDDIGTNTHLYPPDCAAYQYTSWEGFRYIGFACGDHRPIRVAYLSKRGILFDADGLRPGLGVEMRPNPGLSSAPTDFEPRAFLSFTDLHAASMREPLMPVPADAAGADDAGGLGWSVPVIGILIVVLVYVLRRMRHAGR